MSCSKSEPDFVKRELKFNRICVNCGKSVSNCWIISRDNSRDGDKERTFSLINLLKNAKNKSSWRLSKLTLGLAFLKRHVRSAAPKSKKVMKCTSLPADTISIRHALTPG